MGIQDHLTCLLRNLYAGQEVTVRTGHGTTDWFGIGKGVHQGCILSPCLFNLYAEYIMRNPGMEEAQTGIKISRRNINNLKDADYTTSDTTERLHFHFSLSCIGEGNGNPLQWSLPRESQGQRSLVGGHLWGPQSRTRLKRLSSSSSRLIIAFLPRRKCLVIL